MDEVELQDVSEFLIFPKDDDAADHKWTHQNTLMFLELYKKYRDQVGSLRIKNLKKMYEEISKEMQQLTKTRVTATNCENRWKVLERNYKKYIDNENSTGRGRKFFEYAEVMHNILGKKKNIHPVLLLSADTIHTPAVASTSKDSTSITEAEMGYEDISEPDIPESRPEPTISRETPAKRKRANSSTPKMKRLKFHVLQETRRDRQNYYQKRLEIEGQKLVISIFLCSCSFYERLD
ncbi:unnamed protein product [Ceutorhynchus assimilis]|uniref:Myb/SANT-like DNA-binding domain-containing protein n=1 Tax=Ceutorhynchus assimilis TaxID=467358 RepID=A0A9N9QS38_9CUCU|nr:unnamed protein product [Ceutorhynchus assimilis]